MALTLLALGCGAPKSTPAPTSDTPTATPAPQPKATPKAPSTRRWDDVAEPLAPCSPPALGTILRALDLAGVAPSSFGVTASSLHDDPMLLPIVRDVRASPLQVACVENRLTGGFDEARTRPHPVASAIRHGARLLGQANDDAPPLDPAALDGGFDGAVNAICVRFPGAPRCPSATGALPADLEEALTPILWAIEGGIEARFARDALAATGRGRTFWTLEGGNGLLFDDEHRYYDAAYPPDRAYLTADKSALFRAAAQIAYAVEDVDWSRFRGRKGVRFDQKTPAGWIRIRDAADDRYEDDGEDVLLLLDLGGNDVHLDDVAANRSADNAVSVAIDLDGDDTYGFAADDARYAGDSERGKVSLSAHARQGAARNGIAMLFDLGKTKDTYTSLRASQGYAHQGVGVLFDDGGDDRYTAEVASQGAAQYGIALLIDAEGNDIYRSYSESQGFGFAGGLGLLFDAAGGDRYTCETGKPALYTSPQLPDTGSSSLCQGAGLGFRADDAPHQLSGGLGILRDLSGDDRYEASVFAQGTGYWQGLGLLSDGGGDDRYDAAWYAQGAAAHYAVGILVDAGKGNDVYNAGGGATNVMLGSAHDLSAGIFLDEGGDDRYLIPMQSAGTGVCNSVGLFIDNQGDDRYESASELGSGMANAGECNAERPSTPTMGIMIDAGGHDLYDYPSAMAHRPADNTSWGGAANGLAAEHGAGLDVEGDSGIHAAR